MADTDGIPKDLVAAGGDAVTPTVPVHPTSQGTEAGGAAAQPAGAAAETTGPPDGARGALLVVAAATALLLSLAGSALKNTVQVFITDIPGSLDVGVGTFAWATTVFALATAVASPLVGALADRFGAPFALTAGAALAGTTFLLCAAAPSVWLFVVAYGLLGAFAFALLSFVPLAVLVDQTFAGKSEGLVYAALTNGPAIGFVVLVPLWVWTQSVLDWRIVFTAIGVVFWLVLTPAAWSLRRFTTHSPDPRAEAERLSVRLLSIARQRGYLPLTIAFFGCGVTMAFIDVHLVADLQMHHVPAATTSTTLVVLGITEIAGSLVAGRLCDRGWIKQTLIAGYLLRGAAMLLISTDPTSASAIVFGALFGTSYLVTVVATTVWIIRLLPSSVRGTGIGLMWVLHSVGAAASSQIGADLREATGSYTPAALVGVGCLVVSLVLVSLVPLTERADPEVPADPSAGQGELPVGPTTGNADGGAGGER